MKSDIQIAQEAKLRPIEEIGAGLGIDSQDLEVYGKYKAKIPADLYKRLADRPNGKLILTTAITPTPAGEGKTCTSIGLTQGLGYLGKKAMVCLREPALGPTFGIKGGAAGGGYSQVLPMDEINLHFTGDIHAIGAAHNLVSAMLDNHIFHGNELQLDPKRVTWRLVMDMNYRQLRNIVVGLGKPNDGYLRETGFDITVASEIMAVLCLSQDLADLKERLGRMIVGYSYQNRPVTVGDLGVVGSLAVLLKDAIKPNLVQTLEGQAAFIHGGPFANIAHGNNSIIATKTALKLADYVVTEAGFGSDLGAEKFFDIVAGYSGLRPSAVVLVTTVRAMKMHGGVPKEQLNQENLEALGRGLANLDRHMSNLAKFGIPVVVAINRFPTDTQAELEMLGEHCRRRGVRSAISEVVARGGAGGAELARQVLEAVEEESQLTPLYDWSLPIPEKIEILAREIYGADGVSISPDAAKDIRRLTELGLGGLPLCMAKTQSSLSDDPTLKGAPTGWSLSVREVKASVGAGFLVVLCGNMMTMPGLAKEPAAQKVDIFEDGTIVGLF